jgi:hypothetical protein
LNSLSKQTLIARLDLVVHACYRMQMGFGGHTHKPKPKWVQDLTFEQRALHVQSTYVFQEGLRLCSLDGKKYVRVRPTNVRSNLKFRELLRELDKVGRTTSKDLAHRLGRSVKEISNDLGRLGQMGFAKADYRKRVCKLGQWGDICNRGYEYTYYVSEQGKSYLNWMNKTKPVEDFERRTVMNRIASCLPSVLKTQLLAYHLSQPPHEYKGPSRRSLFLADLVLTGSVLSGEPATLELENRRLAEENQNQVSKLEDMLEESSRGYECKIEEA